jgi:hypothetical protein
MPRCKKIKRLSETKQSDTCVGRDEIGWQGGRDAGAGAGAGAGAATISAGFPASGSRIPRNPRLGDHVLCLFDTDDGRQWEEGTVAWVSASGQHFKASYDGEIWPDKVKISDVNQQWKFATTTLPDLPAVKYEDTYLGEHVLFLCTDGVTAEKYTTTNGKPFRLPMRVRGVVTDHDESADLFTVEVPQQPQIGVRKFTRAELLKLLWREMPDAVKQTSKHDRMLFCKWKHVMLPSGQKKRLHGVCEVLGGNYMDCLPGMNYNEIGGRGHLSKFARTDLERDNSVDTFIAVSTRVHSLAPKQAGLPGSIFFEGMAPFFAAFKQQGRPTNLFVCHHNEAKHRWEYMGRYEITNEDSFVADADLREGEDGHGDVWSKNMSEDAKAEFARSAARNEGGWGCRRWMENNPTHPYVQGRKWSSFAEAEREQLVHRLFSEGLMKEDRLQLSFVDYDEDVYDALRKNELGYSLR